MTTPDIALPPSGPGAGSDYAALSRLVRSAGLLRRRPLAYVRQVGLTVLLFAGAVALVVGLGESWWQLLAAAALGVAYTQMAFLGHDGGHQQIFATRRANDLVGRLSGNLLVGLSYGWWVGKHNRHHAHPNREEHDPDIGDGVLAWTTRQAVSRTGRVGRFIVRRQAWMFFPLLTLEGLQLHVASVQALLPSGTRSSRGGRRWVEAVMLGLHATLYLGGLLLVMSPVQALCFVGIHQAVFGLYMGGSFAPNHKGMPIIGADEDVDYLRRQVLTARNVRGGPFVDWLLGGLNYQIEHHLFPNMPRPSLPRAQRLVRNFCAEHGVSYTETSLPGSYRAALRYLDELGAPLRAPAVVLATPLPVRQA